MQLHHFLVVTAICAVTIYCDDPALNGNMKEQRWDNGTRKQVNADGKNLCLQRGATDLYDDETLYLCTSCFYEIRRNPLLYKPSVFTEELCKGDDDGWAGLGRCFSGEGLCRQRMTAV